VNDESEADEGRAVPSAADTPDDAVEGVVEDTSDGLTDSEVAQVSVVKKASADEESADSEESVEAELETSEAESAGAERESALVGAAAAGSARAAARRSGVRAGITPTKGTATRPRDSGRETRINVFSRLLRFLREVVAELRKVIWPARNQMVTYTIVVIVFVVFMVALTAGLDVLFAKGVLAVFG